MALNIFPRRDNKPAPAPAAEPEPAPSMEDANASETADDASPAKTRSTRTRRTTARSRSTKTGDEKTAPEQDKTAEPAEAEEPRSTRSRGGRGRSRKTDDAAQQGETEEKAPSRGRGSRSSTAAASTPDLEPLVKAIEQQGKQIEALSRALQDGQGRSGVSTYAPPSRVGVFVDVANVELGADRSRIHLDWGKVLRFLCRDRQLIRAIAYAPVHDDPQVSRETQRFVEPFLDKGYKIITKPLKRFSDGTIKANVDIELALDVVNMLDRLDVVCLVSGDGDFEPLVKAAQDRGVRVEVVAMASSCSNHLRAASDAFIDLASHAKDVKKG